MSRNRIYAQVDSNASAFLQLQAVNRALKDIDRDMAREFRKVVKDEFTDPLANYIRVAGRTFGRHGPRLARTIESRGGQTPTLRIGSLREPTWAGAAFGGRAKERRAQTMTWPNVSGRPKTRKIIYRRQTMQFLPHLGTTGYIVFPTWRKHDRELSERLVRAMDDFIRDKVGGV